MNTAFQQGSASASLDVLFSKVTDVVLLELKKIKNVNNAVLMLETTTLKAQNLLWRVDRSQFQGNASLTTALRERGDTLVRLCYDALDVVDKLTLMIEKRNSSSGKKGWTVRDVILHSLGTWKIPHAISKLQEKLNSILEQLTDLEEILPDECSNPNSETLSIKVGDYVKSPLFGRENDVQAVIEHLISCGSDDGVSVIGMAGLGKTALAQTVINDAIIVQEFSIRLCVPVLRGSFKKKETIDGLANLSQNVKAGSNNKFLIIFDDLSEMALVGWDNFRKEVKAMGEPKFLITTRNPSISKLTGTTPYYLTWLSDKICKSVIMEEAKNRGLSGPRLSQAADTLAPKCGGLPLVAQLIGLVLATRNEDKWDTLYKEDLWEWPVFKKEIYPLLKSSYKDMQSDMKNCLAFLSLFPPNYCFHKDDLVQLWVGAGFIQTESLLSWDESSHLNELLGRSILQFCDQGIHTDRRRFELHRFNHKFAQEAASKTFKRLDRDVLSALPSLHENTRHLSVLLCESIQPTMLSSMGVPKRLSTLLLLNVCNNTGQPRSIPPNLLKKIQRLRVLALSNTGVTELPDSIKLLQHLRYLDVSHTGISRLPETLSNLNGLQILKFGFTCISCLPKDLQKLTNLLFLDWDERMIRKIYSLGGVPCNVGKLVNLQNLPLFQVGERRGQSITELRNMNNLQGSIHIEHLENVKDGEEAADAMLHKKLSLKRIELRWNNTSENASISKDVLEGLKLPDFVKELKITNYGCDKFPDQWLSHPLFMLEKIHLLKCFSCTLLPALQHLQALKVLILEDMTSLTSVDTSLCGIPTNGRNKNLFPSLEILEFNDMPMLQEWRGLKANAMPQLRELRLISCPAMVIFPSLENLTSLVNVDIESCQALESLSKLPSSLKSIIIRESPKLKDQCQFGGTEWLKIQSVPNVEIDYKKIPTFAAICGKAATAGTGLLKYALICSSFVFLLFLTWNFSSS